MTRAQALFPNPRYTGWRVVALAFLCSALSSPGQSFAFSLYLDHLIRDVGISRVELSTLYAVTTLAAAACLPFVGRIADRRDGRVFLTGVLVLMSGALGLGIAGAAGALLYGGLLGLSSGTIATTNTMVWPDYYGIEALGAVKGVVDAVRNGATAVGPPLAALLVAGDGSFARALLVFGGMAAAAGVAALFLRPPSFDAAPSPRVV